MMRKVLLAFTILCVVLLSCSCGRVTYKNKKADDDLSKQIYETFQEDIYYISKEDNQGIQFYEFLLRKQDKEILKQFILTVDDILKQSGEKVCVRMANQVPGGEEINFHLKNYVDDSSNSEPLNGAKNIYIGYPNVSENELFMDPEIFTVLEDIQFLSIVKKMQKIAEEQNIDWYQVWPSLEKMQIIVFEHGELVVEEVSPPKSTEEPVSEPDDKWSEKIPWGDLDGDGTEEYILLEGGDFLGQNVVNGRITMYVNNEPVYQYAEELRIMGVGDKAYFDLNGDGQKEIFVPFYPDVNSMPLEEWFVLEKTEDGWKMLEMYDAFPITVVLDKKDFDLSIRCDGWGEEIAFDATAHYEFRKAELEAGNNAYDAFRNGQYEVGDVVGEPLPWGIWEIQAGTYNGQNCLIAEHGLGGPRGRYDYYGDADVYFGFDVDGKIKILDVEFRPTGY